MTTTQKSLIDSVPKGLFIGGTWRDATGGATLPVEDPSSGSTLTHVADATVAYGRAALDAAVAAQADWARTPPRDRGEILRTAFERITERAEDFATLMTLEMGKTLAESRGEVTYGAEFFRWFSEEAVRIHGRWSTAPNGATRLLTMKKPVGPTQDRPCAGGRLHHGGQAGQPDPADHARPRRAAARVWPARRRSQRRHHHAHQRRHGADHP